MRIIGTIVIVITLGSARVFNNNDKIEFIPFDYDMALGHSFFYTSTTGIYDWGYHFGELMALTFLLPAEFFDVMFPPFSPLVEKIF